jgi:cell division ATPase FtsA
LGFISGDLSQSRLTPFLGSGVVLTGWRSSSCLVLIEMAEYQFDLPVRLGLPMSNGWINRWIKIRPICYSGCWLLIYGLEQKRFVQSQKDQLENRKHPLISLQIK